MPNRINPPTNFYYGHRGAPTTSVWKAKTQIDYVPKLVAHATENSYGSGTWYPKARPLKQYRLRGSTYSLGTHKDSNRDSSCVDCSNVYLRIGKPFFLLGKDTDGNAMTVKRYSDGCLVIDHPQIARVRARGWANTNVNKNYYSDTRGYLQARSKIYQYKLMNHKADNVTYYDSAGNYIWPTAVSNGKNLTGSSSTYQGQGSCDSPNCNYTIYKPNNWQYQTQGAVSSSSRVDKLKYDTITKNSASFYSATTPITWGYAGSTTSVNPNIHYTGNATAPYFIKSKVTKPKMFNIYGNKNICGGAGTAGGCMAFSIPLALG